MLRFLSLLICLGLMGIAPTRPAQAERPLNILVLGDSFMTSNTIARRAVPQLLARGLGAKVKSNAVTGARYMYKLPITGAMGLNISKQYRKGPWDWVIVNGGGNDFWLGCGCLRCKRRLNKLISPDGSAGAVPDLVARARADGAKVLYVGYLRSPGVGSPIEHCRKVGDAFEARVSVMARQDPGVQYVSLADMVPHGDRSYHALDMIHPSIKGSSAATRRIMAAIKAAR